MWPMLLGLSIALSASLAFADLQLTLTQGQPNAQPVAVVPFAGQAVASPLDVDDTQNIAQIIRQDLSSTGQFRIPPLSRWQAWATAPGSVPAAKWRAKGMNDVVWGAVTAEGDQRRVNFSLLSLYQADKKQTQPARWQQQYTVAATQLRALAHQLSDIIYQRLTGVRGNFSTRLAYVLVQKPAGQSLPVYRLQVSDADGANAVTLLKSWWPIMSPAWSPDGQSLAYVSFEGNRAAVYLQNLATAKRQRLSAAQGINGAPAFSPDGRQIALVLSRTGNPKIYLMDLASGHLKQVTFGRSIDTEPAFSPDGQQLVFTSNRGGQPQIYQLALKSGQITRLTFNGNYNAHAQFLPSGSGLVLMHRGQEGFQIAILQLSNHHWTLLSNTGVDESPSVAPNGQMIVYATRMGARNSLAQVALDGRTRLRLPTASGSVREPAWSPFLTH